MNETIKRIPWLALPLITFWYSLYGWGLCIISAPFLYWAIALGISAFLSLTIAYYYLVAIPAILVASLFVVTPLILDVTIIRGSEFLQVFANNFQNKFLFGILALAIAAIWLSPLFWANRILGKIDLNKMQVIGFLTGCSWFGLGLGRLLGIWF